MNQRVTSLDDNVLAFPNASQVRFIFQVECVALTLTFLFSLSWYAYLRTTVQCLLGKYTSLRKLFLAFIVIYLSLNRIAFYSSTHISISQEFPIFSIFEYLAYFIFLRTKNILTRSRRLTLQLSSDGVYHQDDSRSSLLLGDMHYRWMRTTKNVIRL